MDPEAAYQEVLKEEQAKGSAPAVAEGRAKAARVRAEHGSPHPKEPKWWPGAQPHLEGAEAVAEAEAPAAVEEPAPEPAEEPTPAAPAEPEPAPAPAEPEPAPAPAEPEPAPAPAEPAPAPAPAEPAPAPAEPVPVAAAPTGPTAATELPPDRRPAGVTHGTTTGTRLRPEDEVTTEAQFAGQRALFERRKLIDELVASGVPEVTAAEVGTPRASWLAVFYVIIPVLALVLLSGLSESESGAGESTPGPETEGVAVVAQGVAFDTSEIELPANEEATINFQNNDPGGTQHNIAIYETDALDKEIFKGQIIDGGDSATYTIPATKPGTYYFQCDVHPAMSGDAIFK